MGRRGAWRRGCCAAARRDRGAAAVEFALVAMPLFLILFGIIQYGLVFYEVQGAAATAKQAAGWAAEGVTDCDAWDERTIQRAEVSGVQANLAPEASYAFNDDAPRTVTATLTFTPFQIVPLIPVPDLITRTATVDVETYLPEGQDTCP